MKYKPANATRPDASSNSRICMRNRDMYQSFVELKRAEPADAWRIRRERRGSKVLIIAPHAGRIEPWTGAVAALIAGQSYNLYRFEGRKKPGSNRSLHITSHRFDERLALKMAANSTIVLGVHGCRGRRTIYVGGRDAQLRESLVTALRPTGAHVEFHPYKFRATEPLNICNRNRRQCGAQLEISPDLRRSPEWRERIAAIAREVIERHLAQLLKRGYP